GRYTRREHMPKDISMNSLALRGARGERKLVPPDPGQKKRELVARHEREAAAVKQIRDYRIEADGKKYRLLRGEFHRHTEISWDGGPDGSLEDMFRYPIDSSEFDCIGN